MFDRLEVNRTAFGLSLLTAVLYNSWPLAFWLDPISLNNKYLSVLEVSGRPYAWLFALGDALTAAIVIAIGARLAKLNPSSRKILFGYIVFGAATLLEAITPISNRCSESISACGISPVQILSLHDTASIVAALGLLAALYASMRQARSAGQREANYKWARVLFWVWSLSGIFLILSVVVDKVTLLSQIIFLLACGLALIALPLFALQPGVETPPQVIK